MKEHCLEYTAIMRNTPTKQKNRDLHQKEETSGATGNLEGEKGRKTNPYQQCNQIRKQETLWIGHV